MVTFTPRLSHARFGQQQQAAVNSAQLHSIPGFSGNGDQASFSHSHPANQLQFGGKGGIRFPGGRWAAAAALGLALLGIGGTAVVTQSGSDAKPGTVATAPATPNTSSSTGTSASKEMTVEQAIELLSKYSTDLHYLSSDTLSERPKNGNELTETEKAFRLNIVNKEMPDFVRWLLANKCMSPDVKDALPPNEQWIKFFADPTSAMFLPVAENRTSLDTDSLYPPLKTLKPYGRLIKGNLGSTTESYMAADALFKLKGLMGNEYTRLVSNPALMASKDAGPEGGVAVQIYDFSTAKSNIDPTENTKEARQVLDNIATIFKATGLKALAADPDLLSKGNVTGEQIEQVKKTGILGEKNLIVYVDGSVSVNIDLGTLKVKSGKNGNDPTQIAAAIADVLRKVDKA